MATHWQLNDSANFALIVCHSGLETNDSECFFFSTMQGVTVLVLVLVWCTQTVHAQQGQWNSLSSYIRAVTTNTVYRAPTKGS